MDRRHSRLVRALTFVGAAGLAGLALWSAGLPPTEWWAAAQRRWLNEEPAEQVASTPVVSPRPASASAAVADPKDLQSTDTSTSPLPLHLVATTPGPNKSEGTARIGTNRANPQTYVAGALLANGARIAEVHRDHVVLERDGKRVDLYLETLVARTGRPADDLMMVGGTPRAAPALPMTREVLTDYIRPSPVFDDETLRGLQVYAGRKSGIFAQLGLRPGDVLTAINDAPILDTAIALDALKEITNGTSIVVRVERNGKSERLVLDGTLITKDLEHEESSLAAAPVNVLPGA